MAHSRSARKRVRQNATRQLRNKSSRSAFRTAMKRVLVLAEKGDVAGARGKLADAAKRIDKAARTRAIHKNAAARYKSRLERAIRRGEAAGAKASAKPASGRRERTGSKSTSSPS
jgi:small subunit ribosomal protein S20